MSARPRIGVTGPVRGGFVGWFFTAWALRARGAAARRITPERPARIEELDGLVLGGGADIDPKHYGMERELRRAKRELDRTPRALGLAKRLAYPVVVVLRKLFSTSQYVRLDRDRDAIELELLRGAVARGLPVLGICRGAQLINVHFGGTLHQDISGFYVEEPQAWTVFPRKTIRVEPGSCLAECLGRTRCRVNALHNQAVDRLGRGIVVGAREANGVVQSIEHSAHRFVLGVQWHPEYLPLHRPQRALFARLVRMAREQRADDLARASRA